MTRINNDWYHNPSGNVYRIVVLLWVALLVDRCNTRTRTYVVVAAWKQCPESQGGGICPDMATCCPTDTPGISGCISSKSQDPDGMGQCCDLHHGCSYGYSCTVNTTTLKPICLLDIPDPPDYLNAPETPQYELCRLVPLPISSFADNTSTQQQQQSRLQDIQALHGFPIGGYKLAYYSNIGSLHSLVHDESSLVSRIKKVLIMIHGSERNADDYLCAGMSLIQATDKIDNDDFDRLTTQQQQQDRQAIDDGSILVIAPKFASPEDISDRNRIYNLLIWDDHSPIIPLSHSWRYGADAMNDNHSSNISSYATIDYLVDYLIEILPNLHQVTVAGHSAGGQLVQRWSLLSSRPFWYLSRKRQYPNQLQIRAVVANPRSYCYMDGRRLVLSQNNSIVFDYPTTTDIHKCPSYNQWQWGLDDGGEVFCPYRDRALREVRTPLAMAERFAQRHVYYLTGEYDVLQQTDRCEAVIFQGRNRNQRAKHYYRALQQYFHGTLSDSDLPKEERYDHAFQDAKTRTVTIYNRSHVHSFHQVAGSPHDHSLMFQSPAGRAAIFGGSKWSDIDLNDKDEKQQASNTTSITSDPKIDSTGQR
jgi:pimeloyl-ACP methyl ester carboxylesterase